nr:hypothetical protein [Tanacetum cinerariifolium]
SPVANWRPWPYVHVHFSEPESPPFPPEQTFLHEEPVEFGPVPRPTGYVDPDDIELIFFGPQPKPMDYVEPDFEEYGTHCYIRERLGHIKASYGWEPTPKRQPTPERPISPPPSSPETEWVVPDPVSPVAN